MESNQTTSTKEKTMMATINTTEKLFAKDKAIEICEMLNNDEDNDWTFVAVNCPKGTGYSFINIFDEDGEFVSKF
jgi:hypothetical protein